MEDILKFKAFNTESKTMESPFTLEEAIRLRPSYDITKNRIFLSFINISDKENNEIYVNDILKIKVDRSDYRRRTNLNHGDFYLNCYIKNVRGDLVYNQKEVEKLRMAIGREQYNQDVYYDYNIFNASICQYFIKNTLGNIIQEIANGCTNPKRGFDYEVIGNMLTTPELFN